MCPRIKHHKIPLRDEEQRRQHERLATDRANLHHLLRQVDHASGEQATRLDTNNTITQQRATIARSKATLRTANVAVADLLGDVVSGPRIAPP